MKYRQQIDENDCGPACIVMVASHYRLYVTIGRVRELCKTDYIGTNLSGMVYAAEKPGFTATPMRGAVQNTTLNQKLPMSNTNREYACRPLCCHSGNNQEQSNNLGSRFFAGKTNYPPTGFS
jgi:ABC-type bacteriocin/lantibiotic exporter with double-glycine peptidase domain